MRTALPKWRKLSMRKLLAEIALKIYILLSEGELEMMGMLFAAEYGGTKDVETA